MRHAYSHTELKKYANLFNLVSLYDLNPEVAEHVALEVDRELGLKPRFYTDFDTMLNEEKHLDAVALVYSILESGHSGFPVKFEDVACGKIEEYQKEINMSVGLL